MKISFLSSLSKFASCNELNLPELSIFTSLESGWMNKVKNYDSDRTTGDQEFAQVYWSACLNCPTINHE